MIAISDAAKTILEVMHPEDEKPSWAEARARAAAVVVASMGAELLDVFERPFDGEDDPRIQLARCLTRTEAQAVLEFRGNIASALAESQAQ